MRPAHFALLLLLITENAKAPDPSRSSHLPAHASIAIVGAGPSGLSAATRLLELGYHDVTIFEASQRVGGRVHPVPFEDGYLQLGAEFINGHKNPIYDMAESLGLLERVQEDYDMIDTAHFETGDCPLDETHIERFYGFADPLKEKYRVLASPMGGNRTDSVRSLFEADYPKFIEEQQLAPKRHIYDALASLHESYFEGEWAANWDDLSIRNFYQWDNLDEGPQTREHVMNRHGYKAILKHITSKIPRPLIRYNSRVTLVDYSDKGVTLTLQSGEKTRKFDAVIVTVPLGHLKRFSKTMFKPKLPSYKQEAIDKLGFGALGKIWLVYDQPFWNDQIHSFITLPVDGCSKNPLPTDSLYKTFESLNWNKNVLLGWLSGEGPYTVDAMNDQEVKTSVTSLFRRMFQNSSIPEPKDVKRAKWTKNPLFGGAYSYITVEAANAGIDYSHMAEPIFVDGKPTVLFAGEATHNRIFQCVIGAWLSGRREANRIHGSYDHNDN